MLKRNKKTNEVFKLKNKRDRRNIVYRKKKFENGFKGVIIDGIDKEGRRIYFFTLPSPLELLAILIDFGYFKDKRKEEIIEKAKTLRVTKIKQKKDVDDVLWKKDIECNLKKRPNSYQVDEFKIRNGISRKLRLEIFERDKYCCFYCQYQNGIGNDIPFHVDHIIPVVRGGTNNRNNLITSCYKCNLRKRANILIKDIPKITPEVEKLVLNLMKVREIQDEVLPKITDVAVRN